MSGSVSDTYCFLTEFLGKLTTPTIFVAIIQVGLC